MLRLLPQVVAFHVFLALAGVCCAQEQGEAWKVRLKYEGSLTEGFTQFSAGLDLVVSIVPSEASDGGASERLVRFNSSMSEEAALAALQNVWKADGSLPLWSTCLDFVLSRDNGAAVAMSDDGRRLQITLATCPPQKIPTHTHTTKGIKLTLPQELFNSAGSYVEAASVKVFLEGNSGFGLNDEACEDGLCGAYGMEVGEVSGLTGKGTVRIYETVTMYLKGRRGQGSGGAKVVRLPMFPTTQPQWNMCDLPPVEAGVASVNAQLESFRIQFRPEIGGRFAVCYTDNCHDIAAVSSGGLDDVDYPCSHSAVYLPLGGLFYVVGASVFRTTPSSLVEGGLFEIEVAGFDLKLAGAKPQSLVHRSASFTRAAPTDRGIQQYLLVVPAPESESDLSSFCAHAVPSDLGTGNIYLYHMHQNSEFTSVTETKGSLKSGKYRVCWFSGIDEEFPDTKRWVLLPATVEVSTCGLVVDTAFVKSKCDGAASCTISLGEQNATCAQIATDLTARIDVLILEPPLRTLILKSNLNVSNLLWTSGAITRMPGKQKTLTVENSATLQSDCDIDTGASRLLDVQLVSETWISLQPCTRLAISPQASLRSAGRMELHSGAAVVEESESADVFGTPKENRVFIDPGSLASVLGGSAVAVEVGFLNEGSFVVTSDAKAVLHRLLMNADGWIYVKAGAQLDVFTSVTDGATWQLASHSRVSFVRGNHEIKEGKVEGVNASVETCGIIVFDETSSMLDSTVFEGSLRVAFVKTTVTLRGVPVFNHSSTIFHSGLLNATSGSSSLLNSTTAFNLDMFHVVPQLPSVGNLINASSIDSEIVLPAFLTVVSDIHFFGAACLRGDTALHTASNNGICISKKGTATFWSTETPALKMLAKDLITRQPSPLRRQGNAQSMDEAVQGTVLKSEDGKDKSNQLAVAADLPVKLYVPVPFAVHVDGGQLRVSGGVRFLGGGAWRMAGETNLSLPEVPAMGVIRKLYRACGLADRLSVGMRAPEGKSSVVLDSSEYVVACKAGPGCRVGSGLGSFVFSGGDSHLGNGLRLVSPNVSIVAGASVTVGEDVVFAGSLKVGELSLLRAPQEVNEIVFIAGDLVVQGALSVTINGTTDCDKDPIRVGGGVTWDSTASLQCTSPLWPVNGQYLPLMSWKRQFVQKGAGRVVPQHCTGPSKEKYTIKTYADSTSMHVQFLLDRSPAVKPELVVGFVLIFVTAVCLATPLVRQHGFRKLWADLGSNPPVALRLPWDELRRFMPNFAVLLATAYEHLWLTGVIFLMPLPHHFDHAQWFVRRYFYLRGVFGWKFEFAYSTVVFFTVIWGVLWLPILPWSKRTCRAVLRTIVPDTKQFIARILQYHKTVVSVGNFFFLPMMTILMQPFNCVRDSQMSVDRLSVNPTLICWQASEHLQYVAASCVIGPLLSLLVAYSGNNLMLGFSHPPYRTDLDVRGKRSTDACRVLLLLAHTVIMSVFDTHVRGLVYGVLPVQALYLAMTMNGSVTAYYNINRVIALLRWIGVWGVVAAIASIEEYGPYQLPKCGKAGMWVFNSWWIGILAAFVIYWKISGTPATSRDAELARVVTAKQDELGDLRQKIIELRKRQYHSSGSLLMEDDNASCSRLDKASRSDTENPQEVAELPTTSTSDEQRVEIAMLSVQYMKQLEAYRASKERFLMPFYLGLPADGSAAIVDVSHLLREESSGSEEMEEVGEANAFEGWVKGQLLGRGSYGSVYTGVLRGGGLVAVKVIELRSDMTMRSQEIETVQREVDFIRCLSHPNIIQYKECAFDASHGCVYIFMEYAVGGSLTSLVRKCKELLSEAVIRLYMLQILRGLEYLHQRGVVHRDIKGENILLDARGTAKLADFGCARQLRAHGKLCDTQIGSPYWMAPEVIKKGSGYGTEADIWSVGCTAVEALNGGNPPWLDFDTVFGAMYHISHSDETPNNIPCDLSQTCRSFLDCCFERVTTKRPSAKVAASFPDPFFL
ncbi:Mitogen-activated protein kinase kinase kinase A [Diplonema papillatum]|nr:Mitogen-activated protein kinase kinase kinase A [Diplonema papillatum]